MKGTYRVSWISILYRLCFLGILSVIMVAILYFLVPMELATRDYLVLAVLLVWILALLRYWVYMLGMPHRLVCIEGGRIQTESLFSKREIPCTEIRSLMISPFYPGFLKIVTNKKSISLLSHIDGLHELVSFIKEHNPGLRTRGC